MTSNIRHQKQIALLVRECSDESPLSQLKCCSTIHQLLKDKEGKKLVAIADAVVQARALRLLCSFLGPKYDNTTLQPKATSILYTIASINTSKYGSIVAKCGTILLAARLLASRDVNLVNELRIRFIRIHSNAFSSFKS